MLAFRRTWARADRGWPVGDGPGRPPPRRRPSISFSALFPRPGCSSSGALQLLAHEDPLRAPASRRYLRGSSLLIGLGDEWWPGTAGSDGKLRHAAAAGEHVHQLWPSGLGDDWRRTRSMWPCGDLDVGEHDGRREFLEHPQGSRPVFGRRDRAPPSVRAMRRHRRIRAIDEQLIVHGRPARCAIGCWKGYEEACLSAFLPGKRPDLDGESLNHLGADRQPQTRPCRLPPWPGNGRVENCR